MSYLPFAAGSCLIWVVFGDRWATRYRCANKVVKQKIILFALHKLRNTVEKLVATKELGGGAENALAARRNMDLAALAVCVLFEFGALGIPGRVQMELVASHMRVVWTMNRRREYVISGYPCEPILAVAALYHLYEVHLAGDRYYTLSVMRDAVVDHHIDKGRKGELVARLILILAFYKALRLLEVQTPYPAIPSVSVRGFLSALLPKHAMDMFWATRPCRGGTPNATAAADFKNAKIYFTHFVQYNQMPTTRHLYAAVTRGQAIQCAFQQEDVDIVIPIVCTPEDKFSQDNMSAILIQVRNRTSAAATFPDAMRLKLFGERLTPYISMVFQLGLEIPRGKVENLHLVYAQLMVGLSSYSTCTIT